MWESKSKTLRKGFQSVGAVLYYLLYCPFTASQRTIDFLKAVYFYRKADKIRQLDMLSVPTVNTDDIFPGLFERPAHLLELSGRWLTGVTLFESYVLSSIVQFLRPKSLFEFGTAEGLTTLQLAANAPPHATVYTLDLPEDQSSTRYPLAFRNERTARTVPVGDIFRSSLFAYKIKQLYGDSAVINLRDLFGKIDFVFIDGDHGYKYVQSDSQNAFDMLSANGVIIWHDYGSKWADVSEYLRALIQQSGKTVYHLRGTNLAIYCAAGPFQRKQANATAWTDSDSKKELREELFLALERTERHDQ